MADADERNLEPLADLRRIETDTMCTVKDVDALTDKADSRKKKPETAVER